MSMLMRRSILAVCLLVLGWSAPAGAAAADHYSVDGLRVTPPLLQFGGVEVGSCDLSTNEPCRVRVATLKNTSGETILIGAIGVGGPGEAALAGGTCGLLPNVGGAWTLAPGASCTVGAVMAPSEKGRITRTLYVWGPGQVEELALIPLVAVGV